jgi:hypothetical protein
MKQIPLVVHPASLAGMNCHSNVTSLCRPRNIKPYSAPWKVGVWNTVDGEHGDE